MVDIKITVLIDNRYLSVVNGRKVYKRKIDFDFMSKAKRMLLDDLINWYSEEPTEDTPRKESEHSKRSPVKIEGQPDLEYEARLKKDLSSSLDSSKLILLNGAVVDSLYFLEQPQTNYDALDYLPFDVMFFELNEAVPFEMQKGVEAPLKGILFGKMEDICPVTNVLMSDPDVEDDEMKRELLEKIVNNDLFYAGLFFEGMNRFDLPYHLSFVGEDLKKGRGMDFCVTECSGVKLDLMIEEEPYFKLIDLCVNIIDYINAHNITIVKKSRTDVTRINRRRVKKGKEPLRQLKPVHWIDIKRTTTYPKTDDIEPRTMDYREIVRGHFQRYHTNDGVVKNWVNPFVRGPKDAPWKNNRYRLLSKLLDQEK